METLRLAVNETEYQESITTAAEILKNGGVVGVPTETVYGLAASAYDNNAIKKVFDAKGRPQDNPLIVHISDMEMLKDVAEDIPEIVYTLAENFWPGPLTMVLHRTEKIAESVSAGLLTVAVRMPSNTVALDVIKKSGLPLAAPSANVSGRPSPTSAYHVVNDLDGKIDAVLMGDDCDFGVESTVITLVGQTPILLRPGAVTYEQLLNFLPTLEIADAVLNELKSGDKAESPGMKYKHYAPKTTAFLVEGDNFADFVNKQENAVAVCFEEEANNIKIPKLIYGSVNDTLSLAHSIFAVLREVDKFGAERVFIHAPEKEGVGLAVYNRLIRAAAFKVINI
ncbi:MAG: threonylcarbamoyl-AMP synthase [Clostridia bacterium]|nr:threonylcarbamoyl-AMP synthase [Clostridia bacterium]